MILEKFDASLRYLLQMVSLHILGGIIALAYGIWVHDTSVVESFAIILFSVFIPDLDLQFGYHRSWITHSLLLAAITKIFAPELAYFVFIGLASHLIIDAIETVIYKGDVTFTGFAAPTHPAPLGNRLIGGLVWIVAMASYYLVPTLA